MIDLTTTYLGMPLKNPLVVSASPLSKKVDTVRRLEEAGAAAVVLYSLFEEQITHESHELDHFLSRGTETYAEALSYFPMLEHYNEALVVARDDEVRRLPVDAAFVDLGLAPNSTMVRRIAQTDLDGFIWVDDRNATTQPGLFAAGDVTTAFGEQVLIAIGEGARAALSAYDYLLAHVPTPADDAVGTS